jgi:cholesterol oxidase
VPAHDHDFIVIGSGFGGSVSALRLVEKGYDVLLLEKGGALEERDFPRTNWNLRRWLWAPLLGWRGPFQMRFFRHLTAFSGVGVGGGSLIFANVLSQPEPSFFEAPSWAHLADWRRELAPHYAEVRRMLGATSVPQPTSTDRLLRELSPADWEPTEVGVHFGRPGETVEDPYFGGEGPRRTGCELCGACMTGCRHGAKNTLDRNYLWLARRRGLDLRADSRVVGLRPLAGGGFRVEVEGGRTRRGRVKRAYTARRVVLAGGVMGTLDLLLAMKADPNGLPALSDRLGRTVRTNSEALIGVVCPDPEEDLSRGVAIGSRLGLPGGAGLEVVRYGAGSGFFRLMLMPHAPGEGLLPWRLARSAAAALRRPLASLRAACVPDLARHSFMMLYMGTSGLSLRLRRNGRLQTALDDGDPPSRTIPEADALAARLAESSGGVASSLALDMLLDRPATAHVLGGCCMGADASEGVIDAAQRVFGYDGLWVIDGSAISADLGTNPSLTIAALAERAMSLISPRQAAEGSEAVES